MIEAEEKISDLPGSWLRANLGKISIIKSGGTPSTKYSENFGGEIPWVTPADLSGFNGKFISKGSRSLTEKGLESSSAKLLPKGTVIFSSRAPIGYVAIALNDLCTNQGCKNFIIPSEIFNEYVYYYLKGNKSLAESYASGTTFLELSAKKAAMLPIPLPPLPEQHRIVAKIEELFSYLDAGVEGLYKAKAQLKRYRQAVLKAAVEGRLTEEWRKAHSDVEPAENLLKQISDKRRYGKGKPNGILDYDLSDLPNLPDSWARTKIGGISELIQYGTSEKAGDDPTGIPIVRMGNIQDGKLNFENLKYMPRDYPDLDKFFLSDGNILFNRTNSAELVGKTAVYKNYHPKSIFASYLIRIMVDKNFYNPDFLSYFINSNYGRKYIAAVVSQQVGQANVNGTKLASMTIPLPLIQEQLEIVQEVERSISESSEVEIIIDSNLLHADRLRQSILKRAFEGKLVPQDPNDEPASVLLGRIMAERAGQSKRTKGSKYNDTKQMRLIND